MIIKQMKSMWRKPDMHIYIQIYETEKRVLLIINTKIPVYKVLVYKNQKGLCASLAS